MAPDDIIFCSTVDFPSGRRICSCWRAERVEQCHHLVRCSRFSFCIDCDATDEGSSFEKGVKGQINSYKSPGYCTIHLLTIIRSVIGRLLNGSSWPTILRTDTAATTRVAKRVVLVSILSTAGMIFLGAVSIITPLGLYENVFPDTHEDVEFVYAADTQPIGIGTPKRTDYNVSRLCGDPPQLDCPGQNQGFNFSFRDTSYIYADPKTWMSSVVPSNITEIFSSGSEGNRSRVAGAFDIEYRSFVQAANVTLSSGSAVWYINLDQGRKRTQATFRMYESLILKDQVNVVEGLIVDTKAGGIGFRNHTVPNDPGRGSQWTEGLLWIQPETVCVSTNITFEYTIPPTLVEASDVLLIDRGGFSSLAKTSPPINLNDTQTRPELFARAHKAATCSNSNLMIVMGVSKNKTTIGKSYALAGAPHWQNRVSISRFGVPPMTDNMIPELWFDDSSSVISVNASDLCEPGGFFWLELA